MEKIKLFNLIEKSFLALRKTNKKIWIIGVIIAVFSGGLVLEESFNYDTDSDFVYEDKYQTEDEILENEYEILGAIAVVGLLAILAFVVIMFVIGTLVSIITYYLYNNVYEVLFDTNIERVSLGLVVKVNLIVVLKILLGLILFIVPGIIIGLKYAPANYVLCKHPELSSKEILKKTKELSKGFKWKIFIFNLFITVISAVTISLCSPNLLVNGYIFIDILSMLITFVLTTITVVYTGLFNVYLFEDIKNQKDKLFV